MPVSVEPGGWVHQAHSTIYDGGAYKQYELTLLNTAGDLSPPATADPSGKVMRHGKRVECHHRSPELRGAGLL
jgi:hypothetical protein